MRSLASGLLQEMEKLTGSEREKKEAIIKSTLGSLFLGEAPYPQMRRVHRTYTQERFTAGSDTVSVSCGLHPLSHPHNSIKTGSSMSFLFLSLVLSPHVQKRAQAELDVVVGRDRLPTLDDRPRLPYIEAICSELLRWQMATPLGSTIPF